MITVTNKMRRKIRTSAVFVILFLFFQATAQSGKSPTAMSRIKALPRDLEVELALSALPPHLRDSATVYALNPDEGFEVARRGTNGFHAFVARNGDDAMQGAWILKEYRDDVLYPISFDEEGSKVQMQVFFDIAAMQAKGMPSENLKKLIQERFKTGYYKAPERPGVSYMLSPILCTYINPDQNDSVKVINFPHIMYFAPNVTNKEIGAGTIKPAEFDYLVKHGEWLHVPYPNIIHQGPHGYLIQGRGDKERMGINKEYAAMLNRLCEINKKWCLPEYPSSSMEHHH